MPAEQDDGADDDGDQVDDQQHEAEREPAADHADVLHHAAEQLAGLPPVVEGHRQILQARVELGAQVVLDLGGGAEHEPAAYPDEPRLGESDGEDRDRPPGDGGPLPGCHRTGHDRPRARAGMSSATSAARSALTNPMMRRGRTGLMKGSRRASACAVDSRCLVGVGGADGGGGAAVVVMILVGDVLLDAGWDVSRGMRARAGDDHGGASSGGTRGAAAVCRLRQPIGPSDSGSAAENPGCSAEDERDRRESDGDRVHGILLGLGGSAGRRDSPPPYS